jgi:hypothetical protein
MKKNILIATALALAGLPGLWANTAPTVVIQSATMRPGTTLMDIVFRVNDPDDATVKTRALAFKDGVRSFANVIKPTAFVEGTGSKIGDAIPANANHTITWDVAMDWDVQLGQVKFEVLAMDGRGLLPLEWITIPSTEINNQFTISKNTPSNNDLLNAILWDYASGNNQVALSNNNLITTEYADEFSGLTLVKESSPQTYLAPFLLKRMGLSIASPAQLSIAQRARSQIGEGWLAFKNSQNSLTIIDGWGNDDFWSVRYGNANGVVGLNNIVKIAAGYAHNLAIDNDGKVFGWGRNDDAQCNPPAGLTDVIDIAAGGNDASNYSIAVKGDGTVVGWGAGPPITSEMKNIISISTYDYSTLALKDDGKVISVHYVIPSGLSNVVAVAAGGSFGLALKSDGAVIAIQRSWGSPITIPSSLNSGVVAISTGGNHGLALKSDGTVVSINGPLPPNNLTNVVSISAGGYHSLALKSDGTVVCWGGAPPPQGLNNVKYIKAGFNYSLFMK